MKSLTLLLIALLALMFTVSAAECSQDFKLERTRRRSKNLPDWLKKLLPPWNKSADACVPVKEAEIKVDETPASGFA